MAELKQAAFIMISLVEEMETRLLTLRQWHLRQLDNKLQPDISVQTQKNLRKV